MALVKRCDCCWGIYSTVDCNKPWSYGKDIQIKTVDDEHEESFDLCPKCRAKILAFIKNENVKEENRI